MSKQINILVNVTHNTNVIPVLLDKKYGTLDDLKRQIAKLETDGYKGDPYMAQGTKVTSGMYKGEKAYGKYQIMPKNWPEWAQAAGLSKTAVMTPENQEKVVSHRLGTYLQEFGGDLRYAKMAWYSGLANTRKYIAGDKARGMRMDVNKRKTAEQYAGIK